MIPCPKCSEVTPLRVHFQPNNKELELGLHCPGCKALFIYELDEILIQKNMTEYPLRKDDESKTD
ncbi:MAG: hypothetical protein G3M70_07135 [Candidatus Nitronauta litoralis]|uniref:Uncharacterized protein n=1 Tax=Candidatus Nitronauta litoralis TaxID=2705533 RepID=A0A7T0FZK2_9BACT|nr:MAG: hypothetical protein G3M70_07135 [Candidatus Nitronauta litoralis]